MRILVVDDDQQIADFVRYALKEEGFGVDIALNGRHGLELAHSGEYDGIVLDVVLPDTTGIHIARELRRRSDATPILMLTSRNRTEDVITGLDAGADDYLVKPFKVEELKARVRALVRRSGAGVGPDELRVADLTFDRRTRRATVAGRRIALTPKEARLLEILMGSPARVVSRAELLDKVWDTRFDPQSNIVDVHITRLRQKLRRASTAARLDTIRGEGFLIAGASEPGSEA